MLRSSINSSLGTTIGVNSALSSTLSPLHGTNFNGLQTSLPSLNGGSSALNSVGLGGLGGFNSLSGFNLNTGLSGGLNGALSNGLGSGLSSAGNNGSNRTHNTVGNSVFNSTGLNSSFISASLNPLTSSSLISPNSSLSSPHPPVSALTIVGSNDVQSASSNQTNTGINLNELSALSALTSGSQLSHSPHSTNSPPGSIALPLTTISTSTSGLPQTSSPQQLHPFSQSPGQPALSGQPVNQSLNHSQLMHQSSHSPINSHSTMSVTVSTSGHPPSSLGYSNPNPINGTMSGLCTDSPPNSFGNFTNTNTGWPSMGGQLYKYNYYYNHY